MKRYSYYIKISVIKYEHFAKPLKNKKREELSLVVQVFSYRLSPKKRGRTIGAIWVERHLMGS